MNILRLYFTYGVPYKEEGLAYFYLDRLDIVTTNGKVIAKENTAWYNKAKLSHRNVIKSIVNEFTQDIQYYDVKYLFNNMTIEQMWEERNELLSELQDMRMS